MLSLIGIVIVVVGFMARLNPLLVVTVAALVTGVAGGLGPVEVVETFGKAFKENRYVSVVWVVLPVIGLLERAGLQERAKTLIGAIQAATVGRLLLLYFILRQATSALGLTSLGGHAQMVRPLIAPMAEAAAETHYGAVPDETRQTIRAHTAAADNIALFFGEDIFIAIASILLIKGFLEQNGIIVEPLQLSIWAIPTAFCALAIHGTRLMLLDRQLAKTLAAGR
ncbi:DUF969 domain-containing protein [Phenylobacterium sp.]|uniref:DUF969 domain-containing protein n=1 Tax=Phenylobacterium sp. TaxID=1871053 RepID=UPI00286C9346|nr:DUF969 domain-containing protein [Phenylobacterium sp.]